MSKFSIIIPTYNRAYVLWKAILSVQNQDFTDWELLVIDDGSKDDTRKLLAEFQFDYRIKYHNQKNQGPSHARNYGMSLASREILVFLDSDDELYPHYLSTLSTSLIQNPDKNYGVCNHNRSIEILDEEFKTKSLQFDTREQGQHLTLQNFYNWEVRTTSSGLFLKKAQFQGKALWKSDIYIEDLEFLMQLACLDEKGFLHIPQTLLHYRQKLGSNGICSLASNQGYAESFKKIYEWHKNDPLMKKPDVYLNRIKKYQELNSST